MCQKIVLEVEVNAAGGKAKINDLGKEVSNANKELKDTGAEVFDITKKFDELSGGAVSGFKNIVAGVQGGVKSMGALKVAIASTGIGLLVVAAAALVDYFTNFEKPLRIVDTVMNAIAAAISAISENFNKLLDGDFIGFFTGVGEAAAEAVEETNKLYEAQERLFEIQKRTIVQNANLRAELEEGLKVVADTTISLEERLKALDMVNKSSEQLIVNQREMTQAQLDGLKAQLALEGNYKARRELEIQIQETTAGLIDIEAALNRQRIDGAIQERTIIAEAKALRDEEMKVESERIAALNEARKAAILAIEDAERSANERAIFQTREKYNNLIEQARKYGRDTAELERKRNEELDALNPQGVNAMEAMQARIDQELGVLQKSEIDRLKIRAQTDSIINENEKKAAANRNLIREAEKDAALGMAQTLTAGLSNALGAQTAAGKAAGVAGATISTYAGAAKSLQIYGPTPLGFAGVASALLAGFTQVKSILSIQNPFGGGGNISATGGGSAPPPTANTIGLISPTQQAQTFGDSASDMLQDKPIKAYVLQQDVTSGADYENKLKANSRFG